MLACFFYLENSLCKLTIKTLAAVHDKSELRVAFDHPIRHNNTLQYRLTTVKYEAHVQS